MGKGSALLILLGDEVESIWGGESAEASSSDSGNRIDSGGC